MQESGARTSPSGRWKGRTVICRRVSQTANDETVHRSENRQLGANTKGQCEQDLSLQARLLSTISPVGALHHEEARFRNLFADSMTHSLRSSDKTPMFAAPASPPQCQIAVVSRLQFRDIPSAISPFPQFPGAVFVATCSDGGCTRVRQVAVYFN